MKKYVTIRPDSVPPFIYGVALSLARSDSRSYAATPFAQVGHQLAWSLPRDCIAKLFGFGYKLPPQTLPQVMYTHSERFSNAVAVTRTDSKLVGFLA